MTTVPEPFGAIVTDWGEPDVSTVTEPFAPLAVSVAVHTVPAGMPVYS